MNYILTDPDRIYTKHEGLNELGTTDSVVNEHGGSAWSTARYGKRRGLGLCYETGFAKDLSNIDTVLETVVRLLAQVEVVTPAFQVNFTDLASSVLPKKQMIYAIREAVAAAHDGFRYAPGMDQGWQPIVASQLMGHYPNGEPMHAPLSGTLLFPRAPERINGEETSSA